MPIVSVEAMKTIDERELQKQQKNIKERPKGARGTEALVKVFVVRLNYFTSTSCLTKPDKGNGIVILDRKLYDNAVEEIISDTSEFERLSEETTLKREASIQRVLRKLKQKNFFNENWV